MTDVCEVCGEAGCEAQDGRRYDPYRVACLERGFYRQKARVEHLESGIKEAMRDIKCDEGEVALGLLAVTLDAEMPK